MKGPAAPAATREEADTMPVFRHGVSQSSRCRRTPIRERPAAGQVGSQHRAPGTAPPITRPREQRQPPGGYRGQRFERRHAGFGRAVQPSRRAGPCRVRRLSPERRGQVDAPWQGRSRSFLQKMLIGLAPLTGNVDHLQPGRSLVSRESRERQQHGPRRQERMQAGHHRPYCRGDESVIGGPEHATLRSSSVLLWASINGCVPLRHSTPNPVAALLAAPVQSAHRL